MYTTPVVGGLTASIRSLCRVHLIQRFHCVACLLYVRKQLKNSAAC